MALQNSREHHGQGQQRTETVGGVSGGDLLPGVGQGQQRTETVEGVSGGDLLPGVGQGRLQYVSRRGLVRPATPLFNARLSIGWISCVGGWGRRGGGGRAIQWQGILVKTGRSGGRSPPSQILSHH